MKTPKKTRRNREFEAWCAKRAREVAIKLRAILSRKGLLPPMKRCEEREFYGLIAVGRVEDARDFLLNLSGERVRRLWDDGIFEVGTPAMGVVNICNHAQIVAGDTPTCAMCGKLWPLENETALRKMYEGDADISRKRRREDRENFPL